MIILLNVYIPAGAMGFLEILRWAPVVLVVLFVLGVVLISVDDPWLHRRFRHYFNRKDDQ